MTPPLIVIREKPIRSTLPEVPDKIVDDDWVVAERHMWRVYFQHRGFMLTRGS